VTRRPRARRTSSERRSSMGVGPVRVCREVLHSLHAYLALFCSRTRRRVGGLGGVVNQARHLQSPWPAQAPEGSALGPRRPCISASTAFAPPAGGTSPDASTPSKYTTLITSCRWPRGDSTTSATCSCSVNGATRRRVPDHRAQARSIAVGIRPRGPVPTARPSAGVPPVSPDQASNEAGAVHFSTKSHRTRTRRSSTRAHIRPSSTNILSAFRHFELRTAHRFGFSRDRLMI
jgi:hypothetical protein